MKNYFVILIAILVVGGQAFSQDKPITGKSKTYKFADAQKASSTKANSSVVVSRATFSSADSVIKLNFPINLKVWVTNTTKTPVTGVTANFSFPNENCVQLGEKNKFSIGNLAAGESGEIEFLFTANSNYVMDKIPVKIELTEASGQSVKDTVLVVKVNESLASTGKNQYRGDPLKGLNVSSAKTELEVGDYYALIIGIDKYKGMLDPLKNAVKDAKALETMLKEKYKFDRFITLYDEQATRKNIIDKFEWLVGNIKDKDNVIIYYSGHGEYKESLNKGFWVPYDATSTAASDCISNGDIQLFLAGIKSKHTLLISDACFSGDILRGKTEYLPFENTEKYYSKVHALTSRQAISSGGVEPVMDGGSEGHSVFTYYLLKALKNNNGRFFDAGQLYSEIKIPIVNNSDQTPNFSPVKNTGDEGGQFIFIKK